MSILQITTSVTGLVDVLPQIIYINTNDSVTAVAVAGYLNSEQNEGFQFNNNQIALVKTVTTGTTAINWYNVTVAASTGIITLVPSISSGSVLLPVTIGHIATFSNAAGQIADSVTDAVHLGNIVAGSATPVHGTLTSFPAASGGANDKLVISAVTSGGNFTTTISNIAMGQSTAMAFADVGNANGRFLVAATATPFTTLHLLQSSGTGGLVTDSAIATANVQQKTQVKAAISGNIGGAGAGPLAVVVAGAVIGSVVVAQVQSSSNPCSVIAAIATNGGFNVTVSADPGANLVVDYVLYIAAQ